MENQNNIIVSAQNNSPENSTLLNNLQIEQLQKSLKEVYQIRYNKNLDYQNFKRSKVSLPSEINMYSVLVVDQTPFIILPGKKQNLLIKSTNNSKTKWVQCLVDKEPFKKGNFYILKISPYSNVYSLEQLVQEHAKLKESNIAIGEPIYHQNKFLSLKYRQLKPYSKSWNKLTLFCSKQLGIEEIKQNDNQKEELDTIKQNTQKEELEQSKAKMDLRFIVNNNAKQLNEAANNHEPGPTLKKNKIDLN